jgi:5-methylcytosine-specific restriction enzyme A
MLRSCKYCSGIHDTRETCAAKPTRKKFKKTDADSFRQSTLWKKKSIEIRQRDKGLCQVCIRQLYNTTQQYTFDTIEVHHVVPLHEDIRKGLSNTNLLALCKYHHYMADHGGIPREEQLEIVREQEKKEGVRI